MVKYFGWYIKKWKCWPIIFIKDDYVMGQCKGCCLTKFGLFVFGKKVVNIVKHHHLVQWWTKEDEEQSWHKSGGSLYDPRWDKVKTKDDKAIEKYFKMKIEEGNLKQDFNRKVDELHEAYDRTT